MNNIVANKNNKLAYFVLTMLFIYLLFGNMARIIPAGHYVVISATELLLLFASLCYFFVSVRKVSVEVAVICLVFFISWGVGYFINVSATTSDVVIALSYAVRISISLFAVFAIGYMFSRTLTSEQIIRYYKAMFCLQLILSLIIFVTFPDSSMLWPYLAKHGIYYAGDPHKHRLVGVVFDPNFYAALLVFPLLYTTGEFIFRKVNVERLIMIIVFQLFIFYTFSRSGFLGEVVGVSIICFYAIIAAYHDRREMLARLGKMALLFICNGLFLSFVCFLGGAFYRYITRFTVVTTGPSAMHRWSTMYSAAILAGQKLHLLIGVGYDYLKLYKQYTLGRGFDSSLLDLLLCLGLPLAIVVVFCIWLLLRKSLSYFKKKDYVLHVVLIAYLLAALTMSFFNNLLFYPFFIFMVGPILFYGYWNVRELSNIE